MATRVFGLQVALAAALVCVGCAAQTSKSAQDGSDASKTFKSADSDGNGSLSPEEVHSALDANSNGAISPDEWNQLMIDPADD